MKQIIFTLLVLSSFVLAEVNTTKPNCVLSPQGTVTVIWKAYKTPAKTGVSGSFNDVAYTASKQEATNLKDLLVGSSVVISTNSVNSKNEGRDKLLVDSFFKIMSNEKITAKIVAIKAKSKEMGKPKTGTFIVEITMNSISKKVPMNYIYNKGILGAEGVIDLFDFQASKALSAINKSCFELHEGKTWNDIAINFEMNIKATVCDSQVK